MIAADADFHAAIALCFFFHRWFSLIFFSLLPAFLSMPLSRRAYFFR